MKRLVSRNKGIGSAMTQVGRVAWSPSGLRAKTTRPLVELCIVAVSSVLIGAVVFCAMNSVREAFAAEDHVGVPGIQSLYAIGRAMMVIDGAENALLARDIDEKKRRIISSHFDAAGKILDESRKDYESLPRSPKEERVWKDFLKSLEIWSNDHERFMQMTEVYETSMTPEAYRGMSVQALYVNPASLQAAMSLLDAAIEVSFERLEERREISDSAISPYREYVIGAALLGGCIATLAIVLRLIRHARSSRRRFRIEGQKLRLNL